VKVISGAQTGVDRAALDVAMELGIPVGGYCPKGRRAEDGRIPDQYPLVELESREYKARTRKNVDESDATLVLYRGTLTPGSALTVHLAIERGKPHLALNLAGDPEAALDRANVLLDRVFAMHLDIVLNVAGSRESSAPGIYEQAAAFLRVLLAGIG
jgi:hypothetical protein